MDAKEIVCTPNRDIETCVATTLRVCQELWAIPTDYRFTDGRGMCYHRQMRDGSHYIIFGRECLRSFMKEMRDDHRVYRGWLAVVALTVHEYAHAVQTQFGMRYEGSVHNPEFYNLFYKTLPQVVQKLQSKGYGKWTAN